MSTFDVEITSSAPFAHLVVAVFESHGARIQWEPPIEQRDINAAEVMITTIMAMGTEKVIEAAAAEIKRRWPRIVLRVLRRPSDDSSD